MKKLLQYIESYNPLSDESWKLLKTILTTKEYVKGTNLSSFDRIPTKLYFLTDGFARGYTETEKGNQYNRTLYRPINFMASLSSMIEKKKATLSIECLTNCTTIEAEYNSFIDLSDINPEIGRFYRKVLERQFVIFENQNFQLITMSAEERYINLRKKFKDIDNLIPQYHIASHLGITPIQLSRIRRRLFSK